MQSATESEKKSILIFTTPNEFDFNFLRLMGVSVKENDSPIGYFGTGLKYAVAVILRNGGKILMKTPDNEVTLETEEIRLRGERFDQVVFKYDVEGVEAVENLGITTGLGKNWEVWQAVRELYSNTLDEEGHIELRNVRGYEDIGSVDQGFQIIIDCEKCIKVWLERDKYFIHPNERPLHQEKYLNTHFIRGACVNNMNLVFYKGIQIGELSRPTSFTYNLTGNLTLTEDRTFLFESEIHRKIMHSIVASENPDFIERALLAGPDYYEHLLDFNVIPQHVSVSDIFKDVCGAIIRKKPRTFNESVVRFYERITNTKVALFKIPLTKLQQQQLEKAKKVIAALGYEYELSLYPINCVAWLGQDTLAQASGNQIYLSKQAFEKGTKDLAATLFEEFVHCHFGYIDESRALQTFLFEKVITLTEQHILKEAI